MNAGKENAPQVDRSKEAIGATCEEVLKNPQISFFAFGLGNITNDSTQVRGGSGSGAHGWMYDHATQKMTNADDDLYFLEDFRDHDREYFHVNINIQNRGEFRYLFAWSVMKLQGDPNNKFVRDHRDRVFSFGIRFPKNLQELNVDSKLKERLDNPKEDFFLEVLNRLAHHCIPDYFAFMIEQQRLYRERETGNQN